MPLKMVPELLLKTFFLALSWSSCNYMTPAIYEWFLYQTDCQDANLVGVSSQTILSTLTLSPVVNLNLVTRKKVTLRMSVIDLHTDSSLMLVPRGVNLARGNLSVQSLVLSVFLHANFMYSIIPW